MNIVMLSPGYPAEMAYFTRALAGAGARVIGVGDQPPHAPARGGAGVARALRARESRRRERGARGAAGPVPARLDRPGGVPLGAVHDPGGAPPGDVRPARPHRRADRAVPGQGDDEARARRRGHPHAVARQRAHRRRGLGGRREGRLPAHRQADRRRRLGRHLSGRLRRGTRRGAPPAAARARGQRRGVRRRGGVHLRHHLRRRADPVRARALVSAAAAADAHARVGQPGVDLPARPVRAAPGRRTADGRGGARRTRLPLRLHAHGVVPASPTARPCSARSGPARPAPASSTS